MKDLDKTLEEANANNGYVQHKTDKIVGAINQKIKKALFGITALGLIGFGTLGLGSYLGLISPLNERVVVDRETLIRYEAEKEIGLFIEEENDGDGTCSKKLIGALEKALNKKISKKELNSLGKLRAEFYWNDPYWKKQDDKNAKKSYIPLIREYDKFFGIKTSFDNLMNAPLLEEILKQRKRMYLKNLLDRCKNEGGVTYDNSNPLGGPLFFKNDN